MEPTTYKPSIYKGAGIYKTGASGGGVLGVSSVLVMYPTGQIVTATDGDVTINSDDSGSFVFCFPSAGVWAITCNGVTKILTINENEQKKVSFNVFKLCENGLLESDNVLRGDGTTQQTGYINFALPSGYANSFLETIAVDLNLYTNLYIKYNLNGVDYESNIDVSKFPTISSVWLTFVYQSSFYFNGIFVGYMNDQNQSPHSFRTDTAISFYELAAQEGEDIPLYTGETLLSNLWLIDYILN